MVEIKPLEEDYYSNIQLIITDREGIEYLTEVAKSVPTAANVEEYIKNTHWKNYYATVFEDSTKSCFYSLDNFLYCLV